MKRASRLCKYLRECISGRGSAKTLRYNVPGMWDKHLEQNGGKEIDETRARI